MRKLTKKSLDELAAIMPRISEIHLRGYIGGGNGTQNDPYTLEEFDSLFSSDAWKGGFVSGMGYVAAEVTVIGSESSTSGESGSISGNLGDLYPLGDSGTFEPLDSISGSSVSGDWSGDASISGMFFNGVWIGNPNYRPNGNVENQEEGSSSSGGGGGGGGGSSSSGGTSGSSCNGVDVNNNHFAFYMNGHETFKNQLLKILSSNSQIAQLLTYFDRGYMNLIFQVKKGSNSNELMTTIVDSNNLGMIYINFNTDSINQNGWSDMPKADNIGYDWSKVKTNEEALVVMLTHEAIHAKHFATITDAYAKHKEDAKKTVSWLLNEGKYSKEFVDIFFTNNGEEWIVENESKASEKMHKYMGTYDIGIINNALNEYRQDNQ